MANTLWTYEDEIEQCYLCPAEISNFWCKLLMLTKIIKSNDMVKEDVEDY